ncbi:MAG: glycosyltransferase involved in cell wall biosynthesis [Alteromonadaceae bacterium]|jgi:glycosyltransferase involved in cell wall biosynthesis
MKISVVIPTFNREMLLRYSLNSLLNQSLDQALFEVIVVDDGGSDNSKQVCDDFKHLINIRYIWQKDAGFRPGKARSVGIVAAEGEYILLIDSGIILSHHGLEKHVKRHDSSAINKVIIGYIYGFKSDENAVNNILSKINSRDVDSAIKVMQEAQLYDHRQWQYDQLGKNLSMWPAPFDIFWTAHVSAKRSELIGVGLFDESFNSWGGEDVDLGIRLFHNNNKYELGDDIHSIHWPHFEQSDDTDTENSAAIEAVIKLNDKYNSWQTSFYMKTLDDEFYSLNKVIKFLGK